MAATWFHAVNDVGRCITNCFPVRGNFHQSDEGAGHWKVAHRATQQHRLNAIICSKDLEPHFALSSSQDKTKHRTSRENIFERISGNILDLLFLLKTHHIKKPSDLFSLNVSDKNLTSAKKEDFKLFNCVVDIKAAENQLTLEVFHTFSALRELDLSMNGIRNINIDTEDFPHLEVLDLSYNYLSPEGVLSLSILPRLKALYLTGNRLTSLPSDMDFSNLNDPDSAVFPRLEILKLDDNKLSHPDVFVALCNLPNLKELYLDQNGISEIPILQPVQSAPSSQRLASINPSEGEPQYVSDFSEEKWARKQQKFDQDVSDGGTMTQEDRIDYMLSFTKQDSDMAEIDFTFLPRQPQDFLFLKQFPVCRDYSCFLGSRNGSRISWINLNPELDSPFPKLRYLSLADNKITNEDGLIAASLFPSLSELVIYGNPLVTLRSGDPPLLANFLQHRMGIKLIRRKGSGMQKLHISIPVNINRKINAYIPKIPKHPLMLEASHHYYQEFLSGKPKLLGFGKESQLSDDHLLPVRSFIKEQTEVLEEKTRDFIRLPTTGDENMESVFMTQVNNFPDVPCKPQRKKSKKLKRKSKKEAELDKKQSYEELLNAKTDPDFIEPVGILGNVRALEQALKHLCVYRDPKAKLHCIQKPYIPKEKKLRKLPAAAPRKSKAEMLEDILTRMKNARHITEIPLAPLLRKKSPPRKEHGEALTLLKEVQATYGKILTSSKMRAKELRMQCSDSPAAVTDLSYTQQDHLEAAKFQPARGTGPLAFHWKNGL